MKPIGTASEISSPPIFSPKVLEMDQPAVIEKITAAIVEQVTKTLHRKGATIAVSGGIDSSLSAALCVRALGAKRVVGLSMPEQDSSDDALRLAKLLAEHLQIELIQENITPILEAAGCYRRRDEAIRAVVPEYASDWKCKLVLPQNLLESDRYNISYIVVRSPAGQEKQVRLPYKEYLQIVAASNFKQRTRRMVEYYHADRLNYAVSGTPNRLEYDQGFFVKGGDGLADFKPIAHLYKTQVYALARYLGLPEEICMRPPTTDTFSLPQSQEEFYFCLPYDKLDLILWAYTHQIAADEVGKTMGYTAEQVLRVYRDIEAKRRTTAYLHLSPLLVEPVLEVKPSWH